MSNPVTWTLGLTPENYNYLKCWFTLTYDGKEVFQHIFNWAFSKCSQSIKEELFKLPNYNNSKYRSDFDSTQRKKIEKGDLSEFDLNLFYLLLQRVCFLPGPSDRLWGRNGDVNSLPTILYLIKMKRNALAHTNVDITEIEMLKEIDELKSLYMKALDSAAVIFNIQNYELISIKDNINVHILSIQSSNSALNQQNLKQIAKEKATLALNEAQADLSNTYKQFSKVLIAPWTVAETFQNVKDVFTEPLIKQSKNDILFQQLTEDESTIKTESILTSKLPDGSLPNFILILSQSGMGKTTLVKYIMQTWMERSDDIRGLDVVDLVLYMDCRGSKIKSFEEFILSLMPNSVKLFNFHELKILIMTMQVLVILDNVDELTEEALYTYEELLQMNSDNFRILATSTQNLSRTLHKKCHQKHLKLDLEGISNSNISDCISKMYSSLYGNEESQTSHDEVEMFISEYVSKSHLHSREAMRSPEILSHVFFHWLMQSKKDSSYTTKTQLFLTTHELLCLKLLEKVGSKAQTKLFEQKIFYDNLNIFFDELFRIAYQTFEKNEREISSSVFNELMEICKRLNICHDILKEILCIKEKQSGVPVKNYIITFPSVSQQVFYCAMHVINVCSSKNLSFDVFQESFFENMAKKNIFLMLMKFIIGILSLNDILKLRTNIDVIFLHILKYYQDCTTSTWLEILEETRCHPTVMHEVRKYIGENWTLEDYDISIGLITMLQIYPPKQISLTVCKPPQEIYFFKKALEICSQISNLSVSLQMYYNFWVNKQDVCDNYLSILMINNKILNLESFAGKLSSDYLLRLPSSLKRLALHIKPEDITILNTSLTRLENLILLYINLDLCFEFPAKRLPRLKMPNSNILLYVDIWNISERYLTWACDAIFSFSPAYCRLALRKSTLNFEESSKFLGELRHRRIHVDNLVIGSTKHFTEEEEKLLTEQANEFECSTVKVIQI